MAFLNINSVKSVGVSTAVPKMVQSNLGAQSSEGVAYAANDFIATTGVKERRNDVSIMVCGFGVGLSWGAVFFKTDNILCQN